MAKKETKAVDPKSSLNIEDLKKIAKQYTNHLNQEYRDSVAYIPDPSKVASVSVSKWLAMPEAISDAIGLPGLPYGVISMVYSKPNLGKTTLLMQGIAQAQKTGVLPILILTEHKFSFERLSKFMGADPEAMIVLHAGNLEQAYGYIEKILRDLEIGKLALETADGSDIVIDMANQSCFLFMDSVGNTMSESELEYEVVDHAKSMGKAAKAIKTLTRRINQLLNKVRDKCGILFLNQSYQSMPAYGPSIETPYGGDGLPYSSALILRLRRVGDLKMTSKGKDLIIGLETKIEVKKNHITHSMASSTVYTVASGMIPATKEALDDFKKEFFK